MDRRSFLTGLFGLAGAVTIAAAVKPSTAIADNKLPTPKTTQQKPTKGGAQQRQKPPRGLRRVWKTECRDIVYHGRTRRECTRKQVWVTR